MASRRPSNEPSLSQPSARGLLGGGASVCLSQDRCRPRGNGKLLPVLLTLVLTSLVGCQTHWRIVSDRDAVLYERVVEKKEGIGYSERELLKANTEYLLSKASLKPDISLILVSGDQQVSIRRRAEDPREVRVRPHDWVPMSGNDRNVVLNKLTSGMRPEEVMTFWGSPDESSEIVIPALSRKTWVYHTVNHTECLFFENEALTGWSSTAAARKTPDTEENLPAKEEDAPPEE